MGNKKILAIIGSPKKSGQTIEQVKIFEEILKEKKSIEFEYLFLKDYQIKECLGCSICFNKGEQYCPLNDDRDKIIEKIISSNGVIWISPIYSMHISFLIKKLIDRFAFFDHRPKYYNKKAFVIIVKGGFFPDSIKYLKTNLISWGFDFTGSLGIPAITDMPEKIKKKKIKKIKKLAYNFINDIEENNIKSPKLFQILNFKMWQMRAKLMDEINADYKFFKENSLFDSNYFYPVKINLIKRLIAFFLFKFVILYLKHELGDLKKGL